MRYRRHFVWLKSEVRTLARFAIPDVLPDLVIPNSLRIEQQYKVRGVLKEIYQLLLARNIAYAREPYFANSAVAQRIRTIEEVWHTRQGTCLDLSLLFCSLSLAHDLLPLLIMLEGPHGNHALIAVAHTATRRTDLTARPLCSVFQEGQGILTNLIGIEDLLDHYLPIECTGIASGANLFSSTLPEGRYRDEEGRMSFEMALEAGKEHFQASLRTFSYALDIAVLQDQFLFLPAFTDWYEKPIIDITTEEIHLLVRQIADWKVVHTYVQKIWVSLGSVAKEVEVLVNNPSDAQISKLEKYWNDHCAEKATDLIREFAQLQTISYSGIDALLTFMQSDAYIPNRIWYAELSEPLTLVHLRASVEEFSLLLENLLSLADRQVVAISTALQNRISYE